MVLLGSSKSFVTWQNPHHVLPWLTVTASRHGGSLNPSDTVTSTTSSLATRQKVLDAEAQDIAKILGRNLAGIVDHLDKGRGIG
jgi:hypothetical protein